MWIPPEDIDHYFTANGCRIPVAKGQTESEAAKAFFEEKERKEKEKQERQEKAHAGKDRKSKACEEDKTSIKNQIRANADKVKDSKVLVSIKNVPQNYKIAQQALEKKLEKRGGVITRKDFGAVKIGKKQLKGARAYLKKPGEIAALWAVPEIIEKGILIDKHEKHKNRDYPTYTFAAKVSIGNQKGIVGVVVKNTEGNFYHMHRILTLDGKEFEI